MGVTLPGTGTIVDALDTTGVSNDGLRQVITISPRDLSAGDSIGPLNETAPVTDIALSGLNGRLQRIAQRISSLITALGSPFQAGGSIGNTAFDISGTLPAFAAPPAVTGTFWQATQPVSAASLPLPAGAAADSSLASILTALGTNHTDELQLHADIATTLLAKDEAIRALLAGTLTVGTHAVTGTFWQATQPISGSVTVAPSTTDVPVTPTVTASAYTAGYVLGGIMTFASILAATSFNGVLQSITAKFKGAAVTGSLEVAIFKASPSNGTYADHAAPTWNAADMANLVGIYTLSMPNSKLGTMTIYNLDAIGKAIAGASQSLFAVVIVDGTPTPASTSDFTLELAVLPG
jgi:hypothetical protein